MDLLETLKGYVTPDLIGKAATMLGESESGVSKAVGGILPTVLGGLLGKSSSTEGANELMGMFSGGAYDGSVLDNVSGLLGDAPTALPETGGELLGSLFGDKTGGISNLISSFSGLKGSSVSSLLGMAAPLVMGLVGRQVSSQGLGATGLQSLLMSQKDNITAALPAGLGSMLGLGSLPDMGGQTAGDFGGTAASTRPAAANHVQDENQNSNWWLWLLLLAGLVFAVFYFLRGCNNEPETGAAVTDTVTAISMDTVTVMERILSVTGEDLGGMMTKALAGGTKIRIPEKGVESRLVAFIEDSSRAVDNTTWFDFDRLLFDTGKSTLKFDSSGTEEQLANVVAILKAHPQAELKIGGYTDNTGDAKANTKLSGDRAKAVMAELAARGIAAGRLAAEGYGDQYPVAGNDTEDGKAKNRRVSLRLTKK